MAKLLSVKSVPATTTHNPHIRRSPVVAVGAATVTAGGDVTIDGAGGSFTFRSLVTNTVTGETWVDVHGGANGRREARSFAADRVAVA